MASTPVLAFPPEVSVSARHQPLVGRTPVPLAGPFARPAAPWACSFTHSPPPPLAASHLVSALPGRMGPWLLSSDSPFPSTSLSRHIYQDFTHQGPRKAGSRTAYKGGAVYVDKGPEKVVSSTGWAVPEGQPRSQALSPASSLRRVSRDKGSNSEGWGAQLALWTQESPLEGASFTKLGSPT